MKEILKGVYHWTARHEDIHIDVHSYYIEATEPAVLIDPMAPAAGMTWFENHKSPQHIYLTNRLHYRHCHQFIQAFGTEIWCHEAGLHEFTEDERRHLTSAVRRQYGLDEEHAEALINLAELARREAVDLYQFTKLIKANYSLGQKLVLMEVMWVLVYADGDLSSDEESLLRKVCHLLNLSPGYLADVKKRVEISRDPKDQDAHPSQQESN